MESTPRLYATIVHVLSQHRNWLDRRHLKTLAWMIVGLLQSRVISLTAWPPSVQSRAVYAQSLVRRFDRWLHHPRIAVHGLYGPLRQQALAAWGTHVLSLALDTSLLWEAYCLVRMSLIYRGRAIPMVWKVLQHPCSSVAYEGYADLLDKAMALLPCPCQVVFRADRGFADTHLMEHLNQLNWHWRIRIKSRFWIYRPGCHPCKANRLSLALGEAQFWQDVNMTHSRYGPVHLAVARRQEGPEAWLVVSDEPTTMKTFGVPLQDPSLPRDRVHVQARAHPSGGLRESLTGAAARPPCPHRRGHRGTRRGPRGRAGGTAGPPCPAG
jgi:hypothetical protein